MITTDAQLQATQDRIGAFYKILLSLRKTEKPSNYLLMSTGYVVEIDKMQREIKDYLMSVPQSAVCRPKEEQHNYERLPK